VSAPVTDSLSTCQKLSGANASHDPAARHCVLFEVVLD